MTLHFYYFVSAILVRTHLVLIPFLHKKYFIAALFTSSVIRFSSLPPNSIFCFPSLSFLRIQEPLGIYRAKEETASTLSLFSCSLLLTLVLLQTPPSIHDLHFSPLPFISPSTSLLQYVILVYHNKSISLPTSFLLLNRLFYNMCLAMSCY